MFYIILGTLHLGRDDFKVGVVTLFHHLPDAQVVGASFFALSASDAFLIRFQGFFHTGVEHRLYGITLYYGGKDVDGYDIHAL